jgi:type IV pilus assembly protein PilO
MPKVDIAAIQERLKGWGRNPRVVARVVLAVLVAANLIGALLVFKPWSGSAEDLEHQAAALSQEAHRKQVALDKLQGIVSKVESARTDGDRFIDGYLLGRRTVASNMLDDLEQTATKANMRQKEITFALEPIEGTDTLTKASITAAYEGTYPNLMRFLNLLDRSPRLLIIESLAATPQPQGAVLNISMKLNAFVREGAGASQVAVAAAAAPADQAGAQGVSAAPGQSVQPVAVPPSIQTVRAPRTEGRVR